MNGGPQFSFSKGVSISVLCNTQDEVDRYWDALTSGGGQEVACGWLTDKFGVSWQITPRRLMEMISDSNPEKVKKAMASMITMTKIDLAALERAWEA